MERFASCDPELSIPAFFAGKTVLITGATGFLAKAIVEKILRDLPDVGGVILLVRGKDGADPSVHEAWKRADSEIFGSSIFARLRRERGYDFDRFVREKVECLRGDVRNPDLGLGAERFAKLGEEVDIVINCAASVNFRERLDTALETNVHGVANLLEFARTAGAVFVQVSTAYVSGLREGEIEETVEPQYFDFDAEIARLRGVVEELRADHPCVKTLGREMVRSGTENAKRQGWVDIYTYTKSLGEQCVVRHRGEVPAVIVRPSIIESSLREPEPGWIEGLRMADPIIVAAGRGLTRFPMDLDAILDLIPLDFVVNAILAAVCHAGRDPSGLSVFNVASGSENPLSKRELVHHVRSFYDRHPLKEGRPLREWSYPTLARVLNDLARRLRFLRIAQGLFERLQFIGLARRVRRRAFFESRTLLVMRSYGPYLKLQCRFQTRNVRGLVEGLSAEDRKRFGFDVSEIDWAGYLKEVHLPGLFRHVLHRPLPELLTNNVVSGSLTAPLHRRVS